MKRPLLILFALSTLVCAQAQSSYVGFHLSAIASSSGVTPFAEVQVGGPVTDHVELRLSGVPLVIANFLSTFFTRRGSPKRCGATWAGVRMCSRFRFPERVWGPPYTLPPGPSMSWAAESDCSPRRNLPLS